MTVCGATMALGCNHCAKLDTQLFFISRSYFIGLQLELLLLLSQQFLHAAVSALALCILIMPP